MNHNNEQKLLATILVLGMVSMAPLVYSFAFAQNATVDQRADTSRDKDAPRADISRNRDDMQRHATPEIQFRGKTTGWAIIGGQAFNSEINLSGVGNHIPNREHWEIKAEGEIIVADRIAKLELQGKAHHDKIALHGIGTLENGEQFRVSLKGFFAPIAQPNDTDGDDRGDFALAFTHASVKYMDSGLRIPLMQVGKVYVEPYVTPVPVAVK
ncbi:MAG: hypothetical protein ACT4N5_00490 [Nitrosopumilaceae archaeon]